MKRVEIRWVLMMSLAVLLVAGAASAVGCSSPAATTEQPAATTPETPATGSTDASAATGTTTLDGAALVQERCGTCHPVANATSEDRDAAGWTAIVDDMIAKGAQLTPEEKAAVVAYLAQNYGPK